MANFLTESSDITEYNPTQGVRILEFENPHVTSNNKGTGCEFELWDCGGDPKYVSFRALAPSNDSKISWPPGTLDSGLAPFLACVWGLINDW